MSELGESPPGLGQCDTGIFMAPPQRSNTIIMSSGGGGPRPGMDSTMPIDVQHPGSPAGPNLRTQPSFNASVMMNASSYHHMNALMSFRRTVSSTSFRRVKGSSANLNSTSGTDGIASAISGSYNATTSAFDGSVVKTRGNTLLSPRYSGIVTMELLEGGGDRPEDIWDVLSSQLKQRIREESGSRPALLSQNLPTDLLKGPLIGQGGYANVYSGLMKDALVAIKEIAVGAASMSTFRDVEREFEMLRKLRHRHIIQYRLFEHSQSAQKARIVMDFIPGGSLSQAAARCGALPEPVLQSCAEQILSGLHFIHTQGITHRDIKPPNILCDHDGTLKLADFGCSKQITELSSAMSHVIGTPVYMAPEFIRGKLHQRSDIWSVGCTLLELATGQKPWTGCGVTDHLPLMFHISTSGQMPPIPSDLSPGFSNFLKRCFVRDPEKRPSARDLQSDAWLTEREEADELESTAAMEELGAGQCQYVVGGLLGIAAATAAGTRKKSSRAGTPLNSPSIGGHKDSQRSRDSHSGDASNPPSVINWKLPDEIGKCDEVVSSEHPAVGISPMTAPLPAPPSNGFDLTGEPDQQQVVVLVTNPPTLDPSLDGSPYRSPLCNLELKGGEAPPLISVESAAATPSHGLQLNTSVSNLRKVRSLGAKGITENLAVSLRTAGLAETVDSGEQQQPPLQDSVSGTTSPLAGFEVPKEVVLPVHAGKRIINVSLSIEPSDVRMKMIDRKPSMVLEMSKHVRDQLQMAMEAELHQSLGEDTASVGRDDESSAQGSVLGSPTRKPSS